MVHSLRVRRLRCKKTLVSTLRDDQVALGRTDEQGRWLDPSLEHVPDLLGPPPNAPLEFQGLRAPPVDASWLTHTMWTLMNDERFRRHLYSCVQVHDASKRAYRVTLNNPHDGSVASCIVDARMRADVHPLIGLVEKAVAKMTRFLGKKKKRNGCKGKAQPRKALRSGTSLEALMYFINGGNVYTVRCGSSQDKKKACRVDDSSSCSSNSSSSSSDSDCDPRNGTLDYAHVRQVPKDYSPTTLVNELLNKGALVFARLHAMPFAVQLRSVVTYDGGVYVALSVPRTAPLTQPQGTNESVVRAMLLGSEDYLVLHRVRFEKALKELEVFEP